MPGRSTKSGPKTLVALLRHRAERQPDQVAYRFLSYPGKGATEVAKITYGELDAWARAVAVTLRAESSPGDRALMLIPPGLEYIAYFFGCLYAGLIAVPAYPPGSARHIGRIEAIARDSEAKLVLVGGVPDLSAVSALTEVDGSHTGDAEVSPLARATWLLADDKVMDGRHESWRSPRLVDETIAFLQYTSGSTSDPKGVMVTHGNLLANTRAVEQSFGLSTESVGVSWLPPYHDMGLIGGILVPFFTGFPMNLMSPTSFIREPARWLEAITRYRATASPGPNFSYQMCVDRIGDEVKERLDLSSWVCALNGAEPVRPDVLERFAQAFAGTGFKRTSFYPCYGLAESTLLVTGGRPGGPPAVRYVSKSDLGNGLVRPPGDLSEAQALAGSGHVAGETEVVIVDTETLEPTEAGRVGEIWVRGPSVAVGYFRAPEATEATFGSRLTGGTGPYLRTGDLGVLADGELFVTGRASDLMIFHGRNVYPQDVEATCAASHPAIASMRSAAFTVDVDGEEALVIVQELPRRQVSHRKAEEIRAAIRRRVSEEHQLPVHDIVVVPSGRIPTTSSGKIQRRPCRARYLEGSLQVAPLSDTEPEDSVPTAAGGPPASVEAAQTPEAPGTVTQASEKSTSTGDGHGKSVAEVEFYIRAFVAKWWGCPPDDVDVREPFSSYGFDSVRAISMAAELSDWLGVEVSAALAWEHPSVQEAALALADVPVSAAGPGVVALASVSGPASRPLDDPIAVVGVGCRFPGGVWGVEGLWRLLVEGRSGIGVVPADRWDVEEFFDPDPEVPGRMYVRHGGFLEGGVRGFDAGLFGVSPREAASVDPQHRLVLEVAWQALEHAGLAPDGLRGSATGVFVGMGGSDYERVGLAAGDASVIDAYAAAGSAGNFGANRLSYALGLQGPSLVVDTACSSSLVAVHLACASLRSGECDLALAGGVNVLLSPEASVALAKGRMLSPEGLCKTFDAGADGYVRGEGCGVVVLKRLSEALAAGDEVLAVIRGSAVNQDGRSNGLTAPNGLAQQEVVRRALAVGGVAPERVGYVEAHGTGTALGDPIEVRALAAVLGQGRAPGSRVALGSIKTNIGHLEAAAGIAGLIKAVLVVQRGVIPRHLNLSVPNPHIAWDRLPVWVPAEVTSWPDERRVAGVSSFGFGGTNAHVVLEAAPVVSGVSAVVSSSRPGLVVSAGSGPAVSGSAGSGPAVSGSVDEAGPVLVKVAGAGSEALRAGAGRLAAFVEERASDVAGVAWAAGVGRADLGDRGAVVAGSVGELAGGLRAIAGGRSGLGAVVGRRPVGAAVRVGFVVPGHGAVVAGALAGVYGRVPVVTAVLDELVAGWGSIGWLPVSVLVEPGPGSVAALARTEVAQPALYALAVALGAWWRSVGVEPAVVVGHSLGAYAAAALAGVFSVADGARLVTTRGHLMAGIPAGGAMAAVRCAPGDLAGIDAVDAGDVVVAVRNGPQDTVVSGPEASVASVMAQLVERGVKSTRLNVSFAFHSAQMDPVLGPLQEVLRTVEMRAPKIGFVSDTSGRLVGDEVTTSEYWIRHTREPVLFDTAVSTLLDRGVDTLIELGPGGLLGLAAGIARQRRNGSPERERLSCVASVAPGASPHRRMLEALAKVWTEGADVDWTRVNPRPSHVPKLPSYPFQHKPYWRHEGATRRVASIVPPSEPVLAEPSPSVPAAESPHADAVSGRRDELLHYLRQEFAEIMGFAEAEELDPDIGLFDLGLTSAMVVELRSRLEREVGREIPATAVFDHPTIGRLAGYLADGQGVSLRRRSRAGASTAEPIAIVGMACRFPGGANDLTGYWKLLREGRDATGEVPASRWDGAAFYDADPAAPGKAYTLRGGFLDVPVDEFDADAFGISPREARSMDPQQRLLLEVAWEALDDAGFTGEQIEGSTTGVYVGINTSDYMQLLSGDGAADIDAYLATGNTFSVAAGRLSYFLGAQGPSMAVDTACSSSLVATHLAVSSLRSGESDAAVVAGVNLMLSPTTTVSLAKMRALSPDGRCKAFDAAADGYGRGEGCGVVVLKRLSDAIADEDRIWAVIRGSAVNQDGRSAGLTVPNGQAQQAVIREALRDGGAEPAAVSYVEAHGTGTPLGDPMEIGAIVEALRPDPGSTGRLWVGSAKTNIGHLEAAAGIGGMIKVALALHHGEIPPHLHFDNPSPFFDWDSSPVVVPRELTPWQTPESRVAGVSSFGFSGTNAHVVLEEAPRGEVETSPAGDAEPFGQAELLLLSARTAEALDATALSYAAYLGGIGEEDSGRAGGAPAWRDIARTATVRRTHLPVRMSVVAKSAAEAAARLAEAADGKPAEGESRGRSTRDERSRLLFVYGGQGCQWPEMGRSLLADPVCAQVLTRCDERVRELAGWSLLAELTAERGVSRLADTVIAQPAIFAVEAALTELWRSRGVLPDAVLGHSVGEIAAAHAAGAFDLDQAIELVVRRGQAMGATKGWGAMAVVGLSAEAVREMIGDYGDDRIGIAAVNSPINTVVAGAHDAVAELERRVRRHGARWLELQGEYAFHSPRMLPIRDELMSAFGHFTPAPWTLPVFSTVTGEEATPDAFGAPYWVDNVMKPVLFQDALRQAVAAYRDVPTTVVELSPHAVLSTAVSQILDDGPTRVLSLASMRMGRDARDTVLETAGALHVAGQRLAHRALFPEGGPPVSLPSYPWQRRRHWLPSLPVQGMPERRAGRTHDEADEELLRHSYEIEWRVAEPVRARDVGATGTWILLADRHGVADRLAARLATAGGRCRIVRQETGGESLDPEALRALVESAVAEESAVRGIIHLATLNVDEAVREPGRELDRALAESCGPLIFVPQLLAANGGNAPRLWTITRGAVGVDAPTALAQAPAWGLGRVVALEHPEVWGGLVDLDPKTVDPGHDAELIAAEVLGSDGEDQVAYCSDERRVARLVRVGHLSPPAQGYQVGGDGAYLITGGRGALGMRVAAWLAERGARHLVLLGRRPMPDDEADLGERDRVLVEAIARLREAGVTIHTPSADVTDADSMAAVFDTENTPWPAIKGVVHAAGLFTRRAIGDMDWGHFRTVLQPKVEGSLILDALADSAELDFFVMFSSASSVWGSALAGHYVAANYFQDVLAFDRARRGLPGLAMNWGWWSDSDMADTHAQYFEAMGLHVLPDELGLTALGRLLGSAWVQMTVAPVDWARFRPIMEAKRRRPLLELLGDGHEVFSAGDSLLQAQLHSASSPAARTRLLETTLQMEVAMVLGRGTDEWLDRDLGFFEAGMDSITSVELRGRLEAVLGVPLPATVAFEHPTIAALESYLLEEVLQFADGQQEVGRAEEAAFADGVSVELAQLTEEELLKLLDEEL